MPINEYVANVDCETSLFYTGIYTIIPANSFFVVSATANYVNTIPSSIILSSQIGSTALIQNSVLSGQSGGNGATSCGYSGYTGTELRINVSAKYQEAGSNSFSLRGFYYPV